MRSLHSTHASFLISPRNSRRVCDDFAKIAMHPTPYGHIRINAQNPNSDNGASTFPTARHPAEFSPRFSRAPSSAKRRGRSRMDSPGQDETVPSVILQPPSRPSIVAERNRDTAGSAARAPEPLEPLSQQRLPSDKARQRLGAHFTKVATTLAAQFHVSVAVVGEPGIGIERKGHAAELCPWSDRLSMQLRETPPTG